VSVTWRGLSALLDLGTVGCAAFNSAYFIGRLFWGRETARSRLAALAVLATLSLGVTLEAAALLAMTAETQDGGMSSVAWSVVRFLTFAGTGAMSALVARRFVGR
jgi:hypothetical protein